MANLNEKNARLANKRRQATRRTGIFAVLGCIVVVATALALMVPAVSMTKGEPTCGVEEHAHGDACYEQVLVCDQEESEGHAHSDACYEQVLVCGQEEGEDHVHSDACYENQLTCGLEESEGHVHSDACYEDQLTCDTPEHTHTDACYTNEQASGSSADADKAEAKMPAADFEKKLERAGEPDVKVKVKAPEGAFPENATMEAEFVADNKVKDVEDKVKEAIERETGEEVQIKEMTAVDIVFKDKDGKEIEPAKEVEVKITSDDVRDFEDPILVHVLDKSKKSSKGKVENAEIVSGVSVVDGDDIEDTMKFKSKAFSPYAIVEYKLASDEAQVFKGEAGGVKVTASAPAGAFPEGTTMSVEPVEAEDIEDTVAKTVEKAEELEVAQIAAVDITFHDADGNEVQPAKPIKVTLVNAEAPAKGDSLIVHIDDEGEGSVVEQSVVTTEANKVMFDAESFSVYAIAYTVDFHFAVNGKTIDLSIPGGGFTTMSEIAQAMEIVSEGKGSDKRDAFIDEVESVEFSNPELVSVSKVEKNRTVKSVKDELDLQCEYSEGLTAADIDRINEAKLIAPDWVIISLKPFTSDEMLTVTMKDGQKFTVQVTDSQMALNIHSYIVDHEGHYISLSEPVDNSFSVYHKLGTESNPIDGQEVKDLDIGEYTEAANYDGYTEFGETSTVTVGTNGKGMEYVYGVTPGMYYIQADQSSIPSTITDSEGHAWKYVGTRIETEYVWRQGPNDGKMHVSDTYPNAAKPFNSIPEVVGSYKNYNAAPEGHEWDWDNSGEWEPLLNGFLEFHVYNMYEPQSGNLTIAKNVTVNGKPTTTAFADGTYTFEIWNADGTEQITTKPDGTPIGDLTITVENGQQVVPIEITGLFGGNYIVRETGSTNNATMEMKDEEVGYDPAMRGIVVTVSEEDDAEATFINDCGILEEKIEKIWDTTDGGTIPSSLSATLYANDSATDHVVTLNAGNGWKASVSGLPEYEHGKPIAYHWVEGSVPSGFFATGYEVVTEGNVTTTTITNTHRTYEFTTSYEGTKEWVDDHNESGARPESLHVTLLESHVLNPGEETPVYSEPAPTLHEAVWTKDGDNWTFKFENIPVFDENGEVIIYTSTETKPLAYDKEEVVTPTEYSLGDFVLESGHQRVTPNSTLVKEIASLLDLPVVGIKKGGVYLIWSPRTPTPREEAQAREALAREAHEGFRDAIWYVDSQVIPTDSPSNTVTVGFDPEGNPPTVSLRFNHASSWSWFVFGTFKGGENKYHKGTAAFKNTLAYVTPEFGGTKIWDIPGDVIPDDPILKLTRTVTITPEEGEPYTTAPETVEATPIWTDGENPKERKFSYHDLPKYDPDGNEYTYHVAEASFTVDGVTYTTVRHSDGSYTVTPGGKYVTTQDGNTITNVGSTDFEFSKIWRNDAGEADIWPEGMTITVVLNAYTDDPDKKEIDDIVVTLSPSALPSGWELETYSSGTVNVFSTSGLPATKDGKKLTYYVVEQPIDQYETIYQTSEGSPILDGDRALDGQQIVNSPAYGPVLPKTGGAGTVPYTIAGAIIVIVAICIYGFGSRRGRERGSRD